MGVVIDLDPLGPGVQTEGLADLVQDFRRGRVLGHLAAQGLAGVGQGVIDQAELAAAQGAGDLHPVLGLHREGGFQQLQLVRADIGQDQTRDRLVLVELAQEGGEDFRVAVGLVHARKIGAPAPVLAGPIEEDLDAGLSAFGVQGEDVGLGHAVGVDAVLHGNGRQGADAVAHAGGGLEIHLVGRRLHLLRQAADHRPRLAAQEGLGLVHQF
ncbi:hypothetical protein D3C71_1302990 [compost metagenome]